MSYQVDSGKPGRKTKQHLKNDTLMQSGSSLASLNLQDQSSPSGRLNSGVVHRYITHCACSKICSMVIGYLDIIVSIRYSRGNLYGDKGQLFQNK